MDPQLYRLTVWARYRTHLGPNGCSGDWDPDSGKTHAVDAGRTLCGSRVGSIDRGWEMVQSYLRHDGSYVDCLRCTAALQKARRE